MIIEEKITDHWKDFTFQKDDLIWETGLVDTEIIKLEKDGFLDGVSSVLEIGCGAGDTCKYFSDKGIKTLGIDIHLDSIKKAKSKENKSLKFECNNFSDIKLSESIDMIYDNTIYQNCVSKYIEKDIQAYLSKLEEVSEVGTLFFGNWMKYTNELDSINPALPMIDIRDITKDFAGWWDILFIKNGLYDFTEDYNKELGEKYARKGGIDSYAVLMKRKI